MYHKPGVRGETVLPTFVVLLYLCQVRMIYIIILDPDERRPTTMRSNDTLVDTPFQLISGFFHVNQGVLCC